MTRREHAAIMAGLRLLQTEMERGDTGIEHDEVLTDGGVLEPLTIEEINRLCERINTSDEYKVEC